MTELSPTTQAKLLRALESREVLRLGALAPTAIDVRFISATNRDPEGLVEQGLFRRDLFYRLNGITITIPPLRERTDEIPGLVEVFAAEASEHMGRRPPATTARAMDALVRQPWAGNIRELRNVVERAVVLSNGGEIDLPHLGLPAAPAAPATSSSPVAPSADIGLRREVEELERRRIADALDKSGGNQTTAAKLLGISRRTLLGRLDAYGLPRPRKGGKG